MLPGEKPVSVKIHADTLGRIAWGAPASDVYLIFQGRTSGGTSRKKISDEFLKEFTEEFREQFRGGTQSRKHSLIQELLKDFFLLKYRLKLNNTPVGTRIITSEATS